MSEGEPISELLLRLLENPEREIRPDDLKRIQSALASSAVPEGLEQLLYAMIESWSRLADLIVYSRILRFMRSECKGGGVDIDICVFMRKLINAYKALLLGQVVVDETGRVYIRLRRAREVRGRLLPRGAVTSIEIGLGLLLYAMGDAELASIKPLSGE